MAQMELHCLFGDTQPLADLGIGQSFNTTEPT